MRVHIKILFWNGVGSDYDFDGAAFFKKGFEFFDIGKGLYVHVAL